MTESTHAIIDPASDRLAKVIRNRFVEWPNGYMGQLTRTNSGADLWIQGYRSRESGSEKLKRIFVVEFGRIVLFCPNGDGPPSSSRKPKVRQFDLCPRIHRVKPTRKFLAIPYAHINRLPDIDLE